MMLQKIRAVLGVMLVGGLAAACGGNEGPPPDEAAGTATPAPGDVAHGHDMPDMHVDPAMMQRHVQEADSMATAMRTHIQQMRQLSAEEQHVRIGEHVGHVSRMLSMMDRHMREMGHGTGMDDAPMGEMMGMSPEEHRRMMEQMRTLRSETERLQTASQAEVRRQMPEHLDRLEDTVRMMEQSAAHMHHS
jgi:hypothetical protein